MEKAVEKAMAVPVYIAFGLIFGSRSLSGSPIGRIPETQKMLDFCGQNNITADVEVIPIQKINEAYERSATSIMRELEQLLALFVMAVILAAVARRMGAR
jgi:D-arabinose 1-dehydrogenase-like Zn-dependent alcohol dehydrogenase